MIIELGGDWTCKVDDDAPAIITRYRWQPQRCRGGVYACRSDKARGKLFMHREILGLAIGDLEVGDHINGNTLDNRRDNLRRATASTNAANSRLYSTNSTGFRGVRQSKVTGRYAARIVHRGEAHHLGYFATAAEAGAAYEMAAVQRFGEYVRRKSP
jgi:hypothetical protein